MKEFDSWNQVKKKTEEKPRVFFKEGDVFFLRIGENIGHEQNGKGSQFLRPVLILKKFNSMIFLGVPLTKCEKSGPFYISISVVDKKKSTAIISQIRLFDAKRIQHKLKTIDKKMLEYIKKTIRERIL